MKLNGRVHGYGSGGEKVILAADVTAGDVAVRVVVDLECQVARGADLETSAGPVVAPADGEFVACRMPEQCHLDTVVEAMG
jgi:hypothetical protein